MARRAVTDASCCAPGPGHSFPSHFPAPCPSSPFSAPSEEGDGKREAGTEVSGAHTPKLGSLCPPARLLTGEDWGLRWTGVGLPIELGLRRSPRSPEEGVQRCMLLRGALHGGIRGLAEAERGHTGTAAEG